MIDPPTLLGNLQIIADAAGGVQRLRDLIPELAIRGQLVKQDSSDESVSDLLERVAVARATFASTKTSTTVLSQSVAAAEVPWDIPSTWKWVQLGELAFPQAGFAFKSSAFNDVGVGIPLIRIRDIGRTSTECNYDGEYRSEFIVEPGDYLIGMDGNFNIRRWGGPTALLNQRVTRLIFFGQEIERPFVTWALQNRINHLHGSRAYTTVQHLSGRQIAESYIPVPPRSEQSRIVERAEKLTALCCELEFRQRRREIYRNKFRTSALGALTDSRNLEDLHVNWDRISSNWADIASDPDAVPDIRSAVLELSARGQLVAEAASDEPSHELLNRTREERDRLVREGVTRLASDNPDFERDTELPTGWSWAPLQDLVRFIDYRGRTPTKTNAGVPLITAKNIRRGFISDFPQEFIAEADFDGWMTRGLPRVGDVLFTTEAPMGNAALVRTPTKFALAQRTITLAPYADFSGAYLELLLLSPWFGKELAVRATGMTAKGIKAAKLRLIRIPVPPIQQQHRLVERVEELLGICERVERALGMRGQAIRDLSIALTT